MKHCIILPNNVIIVWKCNKAWKNSVMKVHCQQKLLIHFHFQALFQLPHITVVNLSKNYPLKGFRLSTYKSLQHPPRDFIILLIKIGFLVDFLFANYITFSGSGTYWTTGPVGLCYTSLGRGGCIWLYCSITFYWGNTEKMLKQTNVAQILQIKLHVAKNNNLIYPVKVFRQLLIYNNLLKHASWRNQFFCLCFGKTNQIQWLLETCTFGFIICLFLFKLNLASPSLSSCKAMLNISV